ncbi:MAG: hypothetical protein ACREJT_00695, partial [Myxococcota bacterium]
MKKRLVEVHLLHDGVLVNVSPSDLGAMEYIHRMHSYSFEHAIEHEGYSTVEVWADDCPICDGAMCAVCDHAGTDRNLNFFHPFAFATAPVVADRDLRVRFLRRVYNAAPGASGQQLRDLMECLFEASGNAAALGFALGSAE